MTWYTKQSDEGKKLQDKLYIIFIDLVSICKKLRYMSQEDANWFTQNSIDIYEGDRNTILANAEKRGLENGMKKGLEQGLQQGAEKESHQNCHCIPKRKDPP